MTLSAFLRAYALLWAATLAAAAVVAVVPGAAPAARDAFAFRLDVPRSGTWADAHAYFLSNMRFVAALSLAAWARWRTGAFRRALDALIVLAISSNLALVGAAVGAYGVAAAPWLVHLPLEWAALALPVVTVARAERCSAARCAGRAIAATCLLASAALVETFA